MRAPISRPISVEEVRIIRTALLSCAVIPEAPGLLATLGNLHVVGGCECGCASVQFVIKTTEYRRPIAEGLGILPNGDCVGVMVWGNAEEVTGLEIYDLSAVASGLALSQLQSVIPWEEGNTVLP